MAIEQRGKNRQLGDFCPVVHSPSLQMKTQTMLRVGAVLAGLGVAAGAFGAHGLEESLSPADLEIFETAVRYQMYHALALVLCAVVGQGTSLAAHGFLWGAVIFSGSLYLLVFTGLTWLGAITPIGGTLMLVGWGALALKASAKLRSP